MLYATESYGPTYSEIIKRNDVLWIPISKLLEILSVENTSEVNSSNQLSIAKESKSFVVSANLIDEYLPNWIIAIGWIYFLISLIGGIFIWANSSETYYQSGGLYRSGEYVETVNYAMRSIGIIGVFTSIIVLLICCGIGRVIKQNIFIINKL